MKGLLACGAMTGLVGSAAEEVIAVGSRLSVPALDLAPTRAISQATACDTAGGRSLEVGPGKAYAVPSAAAVVSQSGDVIRIAAGDYRGDVTSWYRSNLTICGVGGRARLFADGNYAQGKAIWVVVGSNTAIDSIEFHGAKVPDRNGAGIRADHGGSLLIRNSGFFDNENGILGGNAGSTISIEGSEFARNGYGDGYSHNIYIGAVDRLTVSAAFFHEAKVGHNLKSRARESVIENSYFMDGVSGNSSYLADFPNGGVVLLRGNLFQKGPNAENSTAIAYAAEGLKWGTNTLELIHNTVVNTRSGGAFLSAPAGTQSVKLTANLFAGTGNPALVGGGFASGSIVQQGNVFSIASNFPGADNVALPTFWPNASLEALIGVGGIPDAGYTTDAPRPFVLRAISGRGRVAGALQSPP